MKIISRFDGRTLYEDDAATMPEILQAAIRSRADLSGADLSRADLRGADLSGADLGGADLSGADLRGADLSGADLGGADLSRAYLSGADLSGADLSGADLSRAHLSGADLRDTYLDWFSHALLGEILRQAAGADVDRRCLAGGIAMSTDWCWDKMLSIEHPQKQWAIDTLLPWIKDGDNAPDVLWKMAKKQSAEAAIKDEP